ncbi:hypothetical protein DL95DRAFT_454617 [Leptodontidium sp. 2 PMI_412]|nr:hypothetical protein DL95DRAFT_454617 [Leptodontidium sp. 2 PMI_412]
MLFNMLVRTSMAATVMLTTMSILPVLVASATLGLREDQKIGIWVNNWCSYPVFIWQHDLICDKRGIDKKCITEGGLPFEIAPGAQNHTGNSISFDWESDLDWEPTPRGLKISRAKDDAANAHVEFKCVSRIRRICGLICDGQDGQDGHCGCIDSLS